MRRANAAPESDHPGAPPRNLRRVAVALALATLALFSPSLTHDFLNFDDNLFVTENEIVRSGLSWPGIVWAFTVAPYSCPLAWVSHMMDVTLFGLQPAGHHFTNILLHAANVAALFLLLQRMTGATGRSAVVAAMFGWHPLHVESVAWIAERRDVLSTLFLWLTLHAYLRHGEKPGWTRGVPVFVFLLLGLLAKAMLVTAPCLLLLLDFWPLRRFDDALAHPRGAKRLEAVATRLLQLALAKAHLFLLAAYFTLEGLYTAQYTGLLAGTEGLPLGFRVETALSGYATYLLKTVWPADLTVLYLLPAGWEAWRVFGSVAVLTAVTWIVFREWRRHPFGFVGWFWFLGTLVPVIGLVQGGSQALADRYTYVPLVGAFIAVTWSADAWLKSRAGSGRIPTVVAAVVLAICAVLTTVQLRHWKNSAALFEHAIKVNPSNHIAHNHLGVALKVRGQPELAVPHFQAALRLVPEYADARFNLAGVLQSAGRHAEARPHFATAIAQQSNTNQVASAIAMFESAARASPREIEPQLYLANALRAAGRTADAAAALRDAARHQPSPSAVLLTELGGLLAGMEHHAEALPLLEAAVQTTATHSDAHAWLAVSLAAAGRTNDALRAAREAVRLSTNSPLANTVLAEQLAAAGQPADAAAAVREALRAEPGDPELLARIALLLATAESPLLRDGNRATALAEAACRQTAWKRPACLFAMATALAASSRPADALQLGTRAVEIAGASGQPALAEKYRPRIEAWRNAALGPSMDPVPGFPPRR